MQLRAFVWELGRLHGLSGGSRGAVPGLARDSPVRRMATAVTSGQTVHAHRADVIK